MQEYFMKSERIGFGIWTESDFENAKKLWLNPNVSKFITASGVFSEGDVKQRLATEIENYKQYQVQYWPIYLLDTDEFIGCCGLRPFDLEANVYEFGVHIIDDFWKKGYANEAGQKVISYAFEVMKVSNLFAGHNPKNGVSKKMLEKLGFKYYQDEFYEPTGLYHPSYLYK